MAVRRVMIIGGPGAGKTWLASRLGAALRLPVHSVDAAVWDEAGALRPPGTIDARVRALAAREDWIIEGGNSRTYDDRVRRADAIIRLTPPRWLRLWRVLRRDGLRRGILRSTLYYDATFGPRDSAALASGEATALCIELRSRRDVERLLGSGLDGFLRSAAGPRR